MLIACINLMHDDRMCPLAAQSVFTVLAHCRRGVRDWLGHRALRHGAAERELGEREGRE